MYDKQVIFFIQILGELYKNYDNTAIKEIPIVAVI